jgi:tRNA(Ile)-lysidine synthetase-like protein
VKTREATDKKLSDFARKLLAEWRKLGLPRKEARAIVAASGGADSTALLLALEELRGRRLISIELKVAHLDHGLRGRAGAGDARWVENLARELGCEFESGKSRVAQRARTTRDNLEQAARRERYEFLSRVARECGACVVATGHTLDDQAETVLLALVRGSGAEGLGGMRAVRALSDEEPDVLLARPLLGWARRDETKNYCESRGVGVRVDAMNEDEQFARVRLRRRVLPLLETFNPRAVEAIARAAWLLREDADALGQVAERLLRAAMDESATSRVKQGDAKSSTAHHAKSSTARLARGAKRDVASRARVGVVSKGVGEDKGVGGGEDRRVLPLRVDVLAAGASAVRRRAIRQWLARARGDLRRVELAHVVAVERLLEGERGGRVVELPGGGRVERRGRLIFFRVEGERASRGRDSEGADET